MKLDFKIIGKSIYERNENKGRKDTSLSLYEERIYNYGNEEDIELYLEIHNFDIIDEWFYRFLSLDVKHIKKLIVNIEYNERYFKSQVIDRLEEKGIPYLVLQYKGRTVYEKDYNFYG